MPLPFKLQASWEQMSSLFADLSQVPKQSLEN